MRLAVWILALLSGAQTEVPDLREFSDFRPAESGAAVQALIDNCPPGMEIWTAVRTVPRRAVQCDDVASLKLAIEKAQPGDDIYLRGDVIYDLGQTSLEIKNTGTRTRPIKVHGRGATIRGSRSKAAWLFHNDIGFWHFYDMKVTAVRYGWHAMPTAPPGFTGAEPYTTATQPADVDPALYTYGQGHDIVFMGIETEDTEAGIYCRNAGLRDVLLVGCNFHHSYGTEGNVDIGEWRDYLDKAKTRVNPLHSSPRSSSHRWRFIRCKFNDAVHNKGNGIVLQPTTYDMTFESCEFMRNQNYGLAAKNSGTVVARDCVFAYNLNSDAYLRGFGPDSGAERGTVHVADFVLERCVAISPSVTKGGAAVNWRANGNLTIRNSVVIGTRAAAGGGFAFRHDDPHAMPCNMTLENSTVIGLAQSPVLRMANIQNVTYTGRGNRYWCEGSSWFKWGGRNIGTLEGWIKESGSDADARWSKPAWADTITEDMTPEALRGLLCDK